MNVMYCNISLNLTSLPSKRQEREFLKIICVYECVCVYAYMHVYISDRQREREKWRKKKNRQKKRNNGERKKKNKKKRNRNENNFFLKAKRIKHRDKRGKEEGDR